MITDYPYGEKDLHPGMSALLEQPSQIWLGSELNKILLDSSQIWLEPCQIWLEPCQIWLKYGQMWHKSSQFD